ncbi:MAG: hypothetical protein LBD13_05885, partial [Spirochaetaceae bacterium]|nr:hypothetical protein [Spirochaetaceae bacterium]
MTCGDCPALSGAGKNGEPCSIDPAVNELLKKAAQEQVPTAWDRYEQQRPLCGFGELGVCCRNCLQGPCRINPFGEPQAGVCGADADLIV